MHLIEKWFNTQKDFATGMALFETFLGSDTFLQIFKKLGETPYTRGLLEKKLQELFSDINKSKKLFPEEKVINQKRESGLPSESTDAPEEIKEIIHARKKLYKKANILHSTLVLRVEDHFNKIKAWDSNEAKRQVFELRESWMKIDDYWNQTQHYDSTLSLKEPIKTIVVESNDQASLVIRRQTLKTYLTPSYLKRIPQARREIFANQTKSEIDQINRQLLELHENTYEKTNNT